MLKEATIHFCLFDESHFFKYLCYLICKLILCNTSTQVFSCEYCEIFKNSFFRTPFVAASEEELLNPFSRISYFNECLQIFLNDILGEAYSCMVIHQEQCIFIKAILYDPKGILYDPAGRERNNSQQLKNINLPTT